MLSISPISFCGRPVRQNHIVRDVTSPTGTRIIETSKDQFTRSYDTQIQKMKDYKRYALKLDNMMYNDSDIKKAIEELPEDVEIEVAANFSAQDPVDEREIELGTPVLIASENIIQTDKFKNLPASQQEYAQCLFLDFDKKGPDKEQILNWLDNLKAFFN